MIIKPRSRLQLCRWVNADLWGEVLNSTRPLLPLFKAIYNPIHRRPANFVVRIYKYHARNTRHLSRYALVMWERRKIGAFYGLSPLVLRRLLLRSQDVSSSYYYNFIIALESRIYMILWRVGYFATFPS